VSAIVASVRSVTAMTVGLVRDRGAGTDVTIAGRMVPAIHRGAYSHLTSAASVIDEGPQLA